MSKHKTKRDEYPRVRGEVSRWTHYFQSWYTPEKATLYLRPDGQIEISWPLGSTGGYPFAVGEMIEYNGYSWRKLGRGVDDLRLIRESDYQRLLAKGGAK